MKMNRIISITLILILSMIAGCKKLVEIPPSIGDLVEENVFTDNTTAISAVTGLYTTMSGGSGIFTGPTGISYLVGLSADEFILFSGITTNRDNAYYKNTLSAVDAPVTGSDAWSPLYNFIFRCNAAIVGFTDPSSETLTPAVRKQLLGEVRFLRAFFYFYLVNMYGDVPLVVSTDPEINTIMSRASKEDVYRFIVKDLLEAKELLSEEYLNASLSGKAVDRLRPTRGAATSLLARAYLFMNEYSNAEAQATELIANTSRYDTVALNDVFLKNSKEAIWQLQPVDQYFNTRDARLFVITASGPNNSQPVYLSSNLLSAFETGDKRSVSGNWITKRTVGSETYYSPFKYKLFSQNTAITPTTGTLNMGEYLMVFRLGEQYLIRAEARIRQNKINEGINDLNVLRARARGPLAGDLPALSVSLSLEEALAAVLHERQVELFSEWGHRWFDLKRTGNVDAVMKNVTPVKSHGTTQWRSYQQLYPIPQSDIDKAPKLTQNNGY